MSENFKYSENLEFSELDEFLVKYTEKSCHLLHVCCAPDLVIAYLAGARGDIFFYNPNIHPKSEYEKRFNEVLKLSKLWDLNVLKVPYDSEKFFIKTKGLEKEPEQGKRCEICIKMRLEKTLEMAIKMNYKSFSTTLTSSPKKSVEIINRIGNEITSDLSIEISYLPNVYRKTLLYNEAQRLIKQLGIYRQNYCGCVYSYRTHHANLQNAEKRSENF
ncbi:MAG: epoxyqueuosine reductase QueH [Fervidobacterium sp.]